MQSTTMMTVAQRDRRIALITRWFRAIRLSGIAKAQYGKANAYMKIFEANKPMLSDPDKIYPGQVLRIPA